MNSKVANGIQNVIDSGGHVTPKEFVELLEVIRDEAEEEYNDLNERCTIMRREIVARVTPTFPISQKRHFSSKLKREER